MEKFLQAEGHTLSTSLISETLWPNGSGNQERIHTLIRRLRKSLSELTALQIKFKNINKKIITNKTLPEYKPGYYDELQRKWVLYDKEFIKTIEKKNNIFMIVPISPLNTPVPVSVVLPCFFFLLS